MLLLFLAVSLIYSHPPSKGLGGYVLSLIDVSPDRTFSILHTAMHLRDGWMDPDQLGAFSLQISFFVLSFVLPCLQVHVDFIHSINHSHTYSLISC